MSADETERRIEWLLDQRLQRIASDASGWDLLLRDPADGRLWELTFPHSEAHGGGPRRLALITADAARSKYGPLPDYRLWADVHELFATDDGSLPEIRINYRDAGAAARGYADLRQRARRVVTDKPYFYSQARGSQPLDSVPNPAELVARGEAEPFHVVFGGLAHGEVELPDIGMFIFSDQIALDYRMGPEWNALRVQAFFALISDLARLDPDATISLEEGVDAEVASHFAQAWTSWLRRRSA